MFIVIETIKNDRWDLIAERVYGDARRFGEILPHNPHLPIFGALPVGVSVFAPVIDTPTEVFVETQPAWRRHGS
jgi:hypothetical protein